MKITTRQVLLRFLAILLEQIQEQKNDVLDAFFEDFFTKDEIIEILKSKFGSNVDGHLKVVRLNKEQLLEYLSDADVLNYFLNSWNSEIEQNRTITPVEVFRTLDQLGLQTHYLASKSVTEWDAYDFSNYRSLSGKAGKITTVYGIYETDVKEEDVEQVTSHPKRFFETYKKAEEQLQYLFSQKVCKIDELHVLPRLVGDA
jgi:hypothetical protein